MIHEKLHDPVEVIVTFADTKVIPRKLRWGRNIYNLTKLMVVHSEHDGREPIHYFSVATETEYFKLGFYAQQMQWYLLEHYQD